MSSNSYWKETRGKCCPAALARNSPCRLLGRPAKLLKTSNGGTRIESLGLAQKEEQKDPQTSSLGSSTWWILRVLARASSLPWLRGGQHSVPMEDYNQVFPELTEQPLGVRRRKERTRSNVDNKKGSHQVASQEEVGGQRSAETQFCFANVPPVKAPAVPSFAIQRLSGAVRTSRA